MQHQGDLLGSECGRWYRKLTDPFERPQCVSCHAYIVYLEKAGQVFITDEIELWEKLGHLICHQCREHDLDALKQLLIPCSLDEIVEVTAGEERERIRDDMLKAEKKLRHEELKEESTERKRQKARERRAKKKSDAKSK